MVAAIGPSDRFAAPATDGHCSSNHDMLSGGSVSALGELRKGSTIVVFVVLSAKRSGVALHDIARGHQEPALAGCSHRRRRQLACPRHAFWAPQFASALRLLLPSLIFYCSDARMNKTYILDIHPHLCVEKLLRKKCTDTNG